MSDDSNPSNPAENRFRQALARLLQAEENGQPLDLSGELRDNPDLEGRLREFFRDRDGFDRLAPHLAPLPPRADGSAAVPPLPPGSRFGDYEILGELGRGGMGVVYKARQGSLQRLVAVKMILAGHLATPEQVKRFQREARLVAGLDHPNIVPIHEVGEHGGQHYFSMKLIEGRSLSCYLAYYRGRPKAAALLIARVARAIHYAHERGILHRDLKPGNILLDAQKRPHVTDFGLAKRLDARSSLSHEEAVVGTASYMAPEQAEARGRRLTPAADVYSLGAVLYELLTGRPPFRAATVGETLWHVLDREPPPPRRLNPAVPRDLETICLKCLDKRPSRRYLSAAALSDDLRRWADGKPILARRVGLSERAWLWCRRKPVLAGLAGAALVLGLVAAGLGAGYRLKVREEDRARVQRSQVAREERQQREELTEQARQADAERKRQAGLTHDSELDRQRQAALAQAEQERRKEQERLRTEAEREADRQRRDRLEAERQARTALPNVPAKSSEESAYLAAMRRAALLAEREQTDALRSALAPFRPEPGHPDLRGWEWYFLRALQGSQEESPLRLRFRRLVQDVPQGFAYSPAPLAWGKENQTLAVLCPQGDVQLLNAATGAPILTLGNKVPVPPGMVSPSSVHPLRISPDGRWLAQTISVPRSPRLDAKLWDLADGTAAREMTNVSRVMGWSPDGRRLYLGGDRVWDTITSSELKLGGRLGDVRCASWGPDSTRLATVGADRAVRFWDLGTGAEVGEPVALDGAVEAIAWSPTGKWVAVAAGDSVSVWDVHTRKKVWGLQYAGFFRDPHYRLTWSLDGTRLVVSGGGGAWPQKLIEGATGREVFSADAAAAYCPDGRRLALLTLPTGAGLPQASPALIILDADTGQESLRLAGLESGALSWSPDGRLLTLASATGTLRVWSLAPPAAPGDPTPLQAGGDLAWSPDGLRCAFASGGHGSGQVRICNLAHPENGLTVAPADAAHVVEGPAVGQISRVAWSPDGKYLATAHGAGPLYLWEVAGGGRLWRFAGHTKSTGGVFIERGNGVHDLSWAPGGRWLASAADNGTVRVWDTVTGKEVCSFDLGENQGDYPNLSWGGDGKYLAASTPTGMTRVWELPAGKLVESPQVQPQGGDYSVVLSPDRKLLAAAGAGGVKLWEASSGREMPSLDVGEPNVLGRLLGWSPDGRYLAYSCNGTSIWDMRTRSRVDVPGSAVDAAWDPEGKKLLLMFATPDYWLFKAFEAGSGKQVHDYGKVLTAWAAIKAPPRLLWAPDGPKLALAHEVRFTHEGPRLTVQVAPHGVAEKSAAQGAVEVVDLGSGQTRFTARVHQAEPAPSLNVVLMAFAWKGDGTALATVHEDAVLRLWDPITGQALRRLPAAPEASGSLSGPPYPSKASLAWAPDGRRVAYARNDGLQVWAVTDDKGQASPATARRGGGLSFQSLAWSPDSRRLAALANRGHDAVVKVWDAATWQETRSFSLEGSASSGAAVLLCWGPDGKRLAAGVQSVHVWDIESANESFELSGHTVPLERLEWIQGGRRIVSRATARPRQGPVVQELIVWDADSGAPVLRLNGAPADYRISPDGSWLAVPLADGDLFRLQHLSDRWKEGQR